MFTGIIHHQGTFKGYRRGKQEIAIEAPSPFLSLEAGESVALNGVCLSLARKERSVLFFNLSQETLQTTTLGFLKSGERLNLELALTLQSALGGHLVTGHVDGIGRLLLRHHSGNSTVYQFQVPPSLMPYVVPKGSIAVDGISLTVAQMKGESFAAAVVPHTEEVTTLKEKAIGSPVNRSVSRGTSRSMAASRTATRTPSSRQPARRVMSSAWA